MFSASLNPEALQALISAKDPVCGMTVDPAKAAATSQYQGRTFFFCAEGCKKEFDASPAKYADKA